MCGRFALVSGKKELEEQFACAVGESFQPRYNIGPGQNIMALRAGADGRQFAFPHWGVRIPQRAQLLINARGETAAEKPSFQKSFKNHRALIPADAFYEWKARQPYCVRAPSHQTFAMAALIREGGCVIITTQASPSLQSIHHRMPAILHQKHWALWLGEEKTHANPQELLVPFFDTLEDSSEKKEMDSFPVSPRVNNIKHDAPDCLAPLPPEMVAEQPKLL